MSTDWDAVCFTCRKYTHLGQRFTSGPAFGFSTHDAEGRARAAEFVSEHAYHDLRIMVDPPDGFEWVPPESIDVGETAAYFGLRDKAGDWFKLTDINDHLEAGGICIFASRDMAEAFRACVHPSYTVQPILPPFPWVQP